MPEGEEGRRASTCGCFTDVQAGDEGHGPWCSEPFVEESGETMGYPSRLGEEERQAEALLHPDTEAFQETRPTGVELPSTAADDGVDQHADSESVR